MAAALVISCLLHLSLILAAYLGQETRGSPLLVREGSKLSRHFSVSLTPRQTPQPAGIQESSLFIRPTEGLGVLPFSAPSYYTTDQLSKRPQPLGSADLDGPEISLIVASGKIVLKLWINEFGEVTDVEVEKTELPEVLSASTVAAFKRLRFTPGERGGLRVGSVMRIEVSYDDARPAAP